MKSVVRQGLLLALFAVGFAGAAVLSTLFALQLVRAHDVGPISYAVLVFSFVVAIRYGLLIAFSWLDLVLTRKRPPYAEGEWPTIAVIVPVYKERDFIERGLQSLDDLQYPGKYIVIVVMDGLDAQLDGTPELIRMFQEGRRDKKFISLQKPNGGKASALNMGVAEANRQKADLILCVDGDTIVTRNVLELMSVHFQDPGIVACAGQCRVRNWLGGSGIGEHGFPFWESLQALEFCVGHGFLRRAQSLLYSVAIIPGPCGMFRLDVLNKMAAATPRFVLCGRPSHPEHGPYEYDTLAEDCDLTLSLLRWTWRNGYKGISYEADAIVATEGRGKLDDLFRQRYRWMRGVFSSSVKHAGDWFLSLKPGSPLQGTLARGAALVAIVLFVLIIALAVAGKIGALATLGLSMAVVAAFVIFHWLRTDREPASLLLLGYMIFETLIWPPFSVLGVVLFIKLALFEPLLDPANLLAWFVALMLLDLLSAVFSVLAEGESFWLVPFIFLCKPLYVIALDTAKLVSMLDVALSIRAVWHDRYVAAAPAGATAPDAPETGVT